jgi:pimeloyl-ACP methyl ester carboxylesterase
VVIVASVAALLAAASASAVGLSWDRCPAGSDAALVGFRCARLRVPLDYTHPRGRQITLAVVKHRATRPAARIGTLFMNPGGPGGQGTVQIPDWYFLLPRQVRQRFDVVSWDPRGIGESTAMQCFSSQAAENAFLGDALDFPLGAAQKATYIARWRQLGRRCANRNGVLLRHVSTADTARDLDRLRQALGASTLTYWGLSYGTILGATYANLFPSRVRALVLDGDIAPSAWTANGNQRPPLSISLRVGSDAGSGMDLNALLSFCGRTTVAACPFSAGSVRATKSKFNLLLQRLLARPVMLDGVTVTYSSLLSQISDGLDISQPFQNPRLPPTAGSHGWLAIAGPLQAIWNASATASLASLGYAAAGERYAGPEQGLAVTCADTPNPRNPERYNRLEPFVRHRAGPIGLASLWLDEPCSTWPARSADNYRGPWNRWTANPILVVGNTGDPSTPYANAVGMAAQLRRARLLTVKGWGHTELLNPSDCAGRYITAYLVRRTLPPPHTVCKQNRLPFAN